MLLGAGREGQTLADVALREHAGLPARGGGLWPRWNEGAMPAAAARRTASQQVSADTARGSQVIRGASSKWHRDRTVWDFSLEVNAWKYSLSPL